jgi:hypothetical protein
VVFGVYQDGQVVGASVDYVAAAAQIGRRECRLRHLGEGAVADAITRGERERPWTAYGYSGVSAGGASVGSGPAGTIVRISGARAANICREIVTNADSVSRIDIQATVRFSRDVSALARRHGAELQANQRQRKRRLSARVEHTYGRGDTLYVGSRSSQWFGRVYDKYRESGEEKYQRCWRYEVECKADAAQKASKFLQSVSYGSAEISSAVRGWYSARGITPCYRSAVVGSIGPIGASDTDAAGQLRWLANQVSGVAKRLAALYGESAVLEVVMGRLDPSNLELIRKEADESLAEYDVWTIQNESGRFETAP